jgi:hypothetical protein
LTFTSAHVAIQSSFVLSLAVRSHAREVVAEGMVASVHVSLVTSRVVLVLLAIARFVAHPPHDALSVVQEKERFVPSVISSITHVQAVFLQSNLAVLIESVFFVSTYVLFVRSSHTVGVAFCCIF